MLILFNTTVCLGIEEWKLSDRNLLGYHLHEKFYNRNFWANGMSSCRDESLSLKDSSIVLRERSKYPNRSLEILSSNYDAQHNSSIWIQNWRNWQFFQIEVGTHKPICKLQERYLNNFFTIYKINLHKSVLNRKRSRVSLHLAHHIAR